MNFKIKSTDLTKEQVDRIYSKTLDCWVSMLHGWGAYLFNLNLNEYEEMELFLAIFKRFVDDGLILVCPPNENEPTKKVQGQIFWNTSSDNMVEYIRKILPKDLENPAITESGADEMVMFWEAYCPEIVWIDKRDRKIFIIGKIIKQNFKRKARKGRKIKFSPVEVKSK